MGLEQPLDLLEVQVPAGFDHLHRRARLRQAGLRQDTLIGDGPAADALDPVVSQPFGQIHQFPSHRTPHVEAGGDHLGGVGVPEPGHGAAAQHVPDPPDLGTASPADLGLFTHEGGFGLGVLHVRMRIPAVVHHVGGPVVDPLPFGLVTAGVQVAVRPRSLGTVEVSGLDRVVVWVVEQVVVHMFV